MPVDPGGAKSCSLRRAAPQPAVVGAITLRMGWRRCVRAAHGVGRSEKTHSLDRLVPGGDIGEVLQACRDGAADSETAVQREALEVDGGRALVVLAAGSDQTDGAQCGADELLGAAAPTPRGPGRPIPSLLPRRRRDRGTPRGTPDPSSPEESRGGPPP
jgi:hypothetical protein